MKTQNLEAKEKELNLQFEIEKKEAGAIEEEIKTLQGKYQERVSNIIRIQGAFALLQELKNKPEGE